MEALDFRVVEARLRFVARDSLRFPALAGNTFRGALGMHLGPELFRPRTEQGPSGLETPPPPFVIRAGHLNSFRFNRGNRLEVQVNVFDPEPETLRLITIAFSALEKDGIGASRGRLALDDVVTAERSFDLRPAGPCGKAEVRFESPTELKGHESLTEPPPFAVLLARARDRVSILRGLYQGGPVTTDFAGLGERSHGVRLAGGEVAAFEAERRSTRTEQRHPMCGFLGAAVYEGDLAEFLPWLRAAETTGVGRHTVWGFGAIRVITAP